VPSLKTCKIVRKGDLYHMGMYKNDPQLANILKYFKMVQ